MQARMGLSTIYCEGSRVIIYLVSILYFSPCIANPTADYGSRVRTRPGPILLVVIDHEIISMVFLLIQLNHEGYKQNHLHEFLVHRLNMSTVLP